tara:strand:- start:2272 stop:2595 length:324 start_codon:yes stop_codon:yes gene_type:complete
MFQLQEELFIWWPVTISVPIDGGKVSAHEIDVQFELVEEDEYKAAAQVSDLAVLELIVKDWKGIKTPDNKDLAFSLENLAALAKKPYVRRALIMTYLQAEQGAPIKN